MDWANLFGSNLGGAIYSKFTDWFSQIRAKTTYKTSIVKRLKTLDKEEYIWIAYCLYYNVQTLSATPINQTANSLLNKGIISQGSGSILRLPYHLQDFVWEYLQAHKDEFLPPEIRDDPETGSKLDAFAERLKEVF